MNKWMYNSLRLELAAVYLAWTVSIGYLLFSGRYQVFLRVGFWAVMLWALIILGLYSLATIRDISLREKSTQEASAYVRLGTVILPLFFILMAQEQSLDSYAFENRSVSRAYQNLGRAVKGPMPLPDDGKVTILQVMENIDDWKGRRVITEGMVYRDEKLPDKHLVVFRFLMVCCAADALPLSVLVETDNPEEFEQDWWVRVEGTLSLKSMGDLVSPHIKADRISLVAPPGNKYLYPSFL
jgi:uncharacterized repeat protein (TIGR03943 family)